jgi:Site-specific recombinases, DNA invertase Pin homologs
MEDTKLRAIGYIRVSSEGQVTNGHSLPDQEKRVKEYAKYRGFDLLGILQDDGISGADNGREGFRQLRKLVKDRAVGAVILNSLERISRDLLALVVLERFLRENGVELHITDTNGELNTGSTDGFISFGVKAVFAEAERRQAGDRTKKVLSYKRARGQAIGPRSLTPYGYRREGDLLVVDKGEQAIIKVANSAYARGLTLSGIARALNEKKKFPRTGKPWTTTQVRRLLDNYHETRKGRGSKVSQACDALLDTI